MNQAILRTLCYADIFDYPLTDREVHTRLIHSRQTSYLETKKTLRHLETNHQIASKTPKAGRVGGSKKITYYYLPGRDKLVTTRIKREKSSRVKTNKTRNTVGKWLQFLPTIDAVYLTGTVAVGNAAKHDDIDLMIVTKSGYLWLSRLIVTICLDLFNTRRKPEHKTKHQTKDKFCVNLYLDQTSLSVPKSHQNLFTAHEVIQATPIVNKHHTHQRFLSANSWVTTHLPHAPLPKSTPPPPPPTKLPIIAFFTQNLEKLVYQIQRQYMKSRQTSETIGQHSAYFHPRNTSKIILNLYRQRLHTYNLHP